MTDFEKIFRGEKLSCEEFTAAANAAGINISGASEREAELIGRLESERERYKSALADIRAKSAVREALLRGGAYNPALALGAIDISDMEGDDASLARAAEEKTARLRASDPYLFRASRTFEPLSTGLSHVGEQKESDDLTDGEYYSRLKNLKFSN